METVARRYSNANANRVQARKVNDPQGRKGGESFEILTRAIEVAADILCPARRKLEVSEKLSAAAIEVECPLERCVAGGADKSCRLQNRGHTLRRVNESSKRISP